MTSRAVRVPITEFASAGRVPIPIIRRQSATLAKSPLVSKLVEPLANCVFILNEQRQIVLASRSLRELLPSKGRPLLGLRLGEALGCIHAGEAKGGCGASKACRHCGVIQATLSSLAGRADSRPFVLTRLIGLRQETHHFLVTTIPFLHQGRKFILLAFVDSADRPAKISLTQLLTRHLKGTPGLGASTSKSKTSDPRLRHRTSGR